MASQLQRLERELEAATTARPRDAAHYVAVLERAVAACRTDPVANEVFDLGELYLELSAEYQTLKRWDDALAAADAVVEAGVRMAPDARCLRAEILMRAGRVAEAEPIWATVHADTPDDVWVYNNAALEYADVGAHETALDWVTQGLRLALDTGDPERLVDQLADLRQASLDALGQPADELQDRAEEFLRAQQQSRSARQAEPEPPPTRDIGDRIGKVAFAWFPAGDYEQAVACWPELAGSDLVAGPGGPLTHPQYCRALQQRMVERSRLGLPGMRVAPIRMAPFTAWCAENGCPPDDAETRARYAAHLAAADDPGLVPWPPGRNDPCWCGSGRKHKKCCASPQAAQ